MLDSLWLGYCLVFAGSSMWAGNRYDQNRSKNRGDYSKTNDRFLSIVCMLIALLGFIVIFIS
jgi:hypothetical protein